VNKTKDAFDADARHETERRKISSESFVKRTTI
jgi:hypothetical protein